MALLPSDFWILLHRLLFLSGFPETDRAREALRAKLLFGELEEAVPGFTDWANDEASLTSLNPAFLLRTRRKRPIMSN
jgi:hypothetical protein